VLATAELAPPDVRGVVQPYGFSRRASHPYRDKLFVGPEGKWRLRPEFSQALNYADAKFSQVAEIERRNGGETPARLIEHYLAGTGEPITLSAMEMLSWPAVANAVEKIQQHFVVWMVGGEDERNDHIDQVLRDFLLAAEDGAEIKYATHWDGRIFGRGLVGIAQGILGSLTADDPKAGLVPLAVLGGSVLGGNGKFIFRKQGDRLIFQGEVAYRFDEDFDFELDVPIPPVPDAARLETVIVSPSEALDLERYRGARPFKTHSSWSQLVEGSLVFRNGTIAIDDVRWKPVRFALPDMLP
jgi:hypothetical protein